MNILKSLFGKPKHELFGNTDAICPNCLQHLDSMPERKKKCPNCSQFMFVRTRPGDGKRVVVTEADAEKIDIQWMRENGTYEAHLTEQREFEKHKSDLTKKRGRQPSDSDVQWSICNQQLITHAKSGNWGLFRNTRFEMAEILRKENRLQEALAAYFEVSYLMLTDQTTPVEPKIGICFRRLTLKQHFKHLRLRSQFSEL